MEAKKKIAPSGGVWKQLATAPPFAVSTALLLTDGSVICQQEYGYQWARLTPDPIGSYLNGAWSYIPSMIHSRRYYASAVLADGRVIVAGGEDSDLGEGSNLNAAEIWDPGIPSAVWSPVFPPPGWNHIGDAPCCVLKDGRFLLGSIETTATAIYDPSSGYWVTGGSKYDVGAEETWTLLPDGSILCVECTAHPKVERYDTENNQWVPAPRTPPGHDLVQANSLEIGPAILMPDGRVLALGATDHAAFYTPAQDGIPESWSPAPNLPKGPGNRQMVAKDSPACLLPNGNVLCALGPAAAAQGLPRKTAFWEFNGKTFVRVADPIPYNQSDNLCNARLLLLPTGQVLYTNSTNAAYIYTPSGGPRAEWRPKINYYPPNISAGMTYALSGTQLNGLSQACSYGDDASMATNYPIVRIKHRSSGVIAYCRTFGHTSMGVATGTTVQWTKFAPPTSIFAGPSDLSVVANGIESAAVQVQIV